MKKKILSALLVIGLICSSIPFANMQAHGASKKWVEYNPDRYVDAKKATTLRSKSSTSGKSLGTVPKGKRIISYGYDKYSSASWYKVKYGSKTGYIKSTDAKLSYQAYSPAKKGTTTANLYMRSGVGLNYSKKVYIKSGSQLTLHGYYRTEGYDWYKVTYGNYTGYVSSKYVKRNEDICTWVQYDPDRYVDIKKATTLRSKSSTSGKSLGTVPKGKRIISYGYDKYSSASWYKVKYGSKTGYIKSTDAKLSYQAYSPAKKGTTTANLYMRSGVGLNYSKKVYIKSGSQLTLHGYYRTEGYDWYKVTYGNYTGYVSSKYVKRNEDICTWVQYDPDRYVDIKKATTLRSKSSTSGKSLGTVPKGKRIISYGYDKYSSASWYKVKYGSKTGYIKSTDAKLSYQAYSPVKKGTITANLYMRSGVGLNYDKKTYLPKSTIVYIYGYYRTEGYDWYKISYNGVTGYASSKNVKRDTGGYVDPAFPASYKSRISALQKKYPLWNFYVQDTNTSWDTAISNEMRTVGRQLIDKDSYDAWKSTEKGAYDFENDKYVVFDGGNWHAASKDITEYYLDPRNFITEGSIFQFIHHEFDPTYQTEETVAKGVVGSFMNTTSYIEDIYNAGVSINVNPNVLVAMIIMEQGRKGDSNGLVSGKYPGYEGYYNFFNIGAYAHSGRTPTENGLIYAKKAGWNTREKAIAGGAKFYAEAYVYSNQNTFYTKKFNVMNGSNSMGTHEYCTNVEAAQDEGTILRKGFTDIKDLPLCFYIPVYDDMPSSPAAKPGTTGNNNNVLKQLKISGGGKTATSSKYNNVEITVPKSTTSATISATPYDKGAKVTGTGSISLSGTSTTQKFYVKVKATSGLIRTYTITVKKS